MSIAYNAALLRRIPAQITGGKVGLRAVNAITYFDNFLVSSAEISRSTYAIAGRVIATRVSGDPVSSNNGLFYLFSDHLGSTSVLATAAGSQVPGSRATYYPFGSPRTTPTQTITDRNFTGQKENMELGLIYYNARYYVPGIARFLTPDTIVSNPRSPQQFNRYTYTLNNPTHFTDPTGHVCYDPSTGDAIPSTACSNPAPPSPEELASSLVSFDVVQGVNEVWTPAEKAAVYQGAYDIGKALANDINTRMNTRLARLGETYKPITPQEAFLQVYGGAVTFKKTGQSCKEATGTEICYAQTQTSRMIYVFTNIYANGESKIPNVDTANRWAVHELGHAFESRVNGLTSWGYVRSSLTTNVLNRKGFAGAFNGWQQSTSYDNHEIFADMFIGWVYGQWETNSFTGSPTNDANLKANFMNVNMSVWISITQ